MANPNTYVVSRLELRRIFAAYGLDEKRIDAVLSVMEKEHKHVDAVQFTNLLEKEGMSRDKIKNVLRRLNMNDILMSEVLNMSDESKISAETGRLYSATIEFD